MLIVYKNIIHACLSYPKHWQYNIIFSGASKSKSCVIWVYIPSLNLHIQLTLVHSTFGLSQRYCNTVITTLDLDARIVMMYIRYLCASEVYPHCVVREPFERCVCSYCPWGDLLSHAYCNPYLPIYHIAPSTSCGRITCC